MKKLYFALTVGFVTCCAPSEQTDKRYGLKYYTEQYRPQYHFSPEANWMNDPNGMVYYEGEYHLFYQYYPDSTVWGPMHWGHAISRDLVKWQHLPIAFYPDSLGYIFSGSAVIDWNNTSGFGSVDNPPMVAIFTHHHPGGEQAGRTDFQYQSIAFSLDKGRSWIKYKGNPVLPSQGFSDFRDPKVFWHGQSEKWVMILAAGDHAELYGSQNLRSWDKLSDFGKHEGAHGGVWECPDLFQLTNREGESKWVMLVSINPGGPNEGSATQYFIGQFDGVSFINDNKPDETLWLDYGPDNYAGVTWSDIPQEDGRRLFIGWMSNWQYAQLVPTEKWRSAMTVPRRLSLASTNEGNRLMSNPVKELSALQSGEPYQLPQQTITNETAPLDVSFPIATTEINLAFSDFGNHSEFGIELSNSKGQKTQVGFNVASGRYFINRTDSGEIDFHEEFPRRLYSSRISDASEVKMKILADVSSLELFADGGATVMTALVFPEEPYSMITVFSRGGPVELVGGQIIALSGIW